MHTQISAFLGIFAQSTVSVLYKADNYCMLSLIWLFFDQGVLMEA